MFGAVGYRYKEESDHWVRSCAFELNGMHTAANLNVLPLGSYSMLLGMDWLYLHSTKVDCFDKAIECMDDSGEKRTLQGKKKPTSVRMVTLMQAKRSCRKCCMMFEVHISSDKGKEFVLGCVIFFPRLTYVVKRGVRGGW